jgi:hypothetical protein
MMTDNIKVLITPEGIEEIEMTQEEIDQAEENDLEFQEKLKKEKTDKTLKEENKASGKQKLKDLGLDDDEINALLGV